MFNTTPQTIAAARKIISPVGTFPAFTKFLYQPLASEDCGQLTDCVFVNTAAIPFAMFMLAIETINGGIFQYATRYPLKIPNRKPITTLKIKAAAIGIPCVRKL